MAFSSLMTNAMEEQRPSEKAMQELRLILRDGIKQKHYSQYEEMTPENCVCLNNIKLLQAEVTDSLHVSDLSAEVIFYHIIPHLNGYAFLKGLALTCHYFNQYSKMSCFTLTDYSVGLAHTIPIHLLRFKIECTEGGLLKAARSLNISSDLLVKVLETGPLMPKGIELMGDIPTTLDDCVENFDVTYPKLKIAIAIDQLDKEKTNHLTQLFEELAAHPTPSGMCLSGNKLRLLSLHSARPGIYYDVLEELFVRGDIFDDLERLSSQEMEIVSRELIREGRQVEQIFSQNFESNDANNHLAAQLLDWCLNNNQLGSFRSYGSRIYVAMQTLGRPDLARKALTQVLHLPNTLESVRQKLEAISYIKRLSAEENDLLMPPLTRQFCEDVYQDVHSVNRSKIWAELSPEERFNILSLMMRDAEKRAQVQAEVTNVLTELQEGKLKVNEVVNVIDDLSENNFPEEVRKLVSYILGMDVEKNSAELDSHLSSILGHSIPIDRENSIVFIKKIVESQNTSTASKLRALTILCQHALTEVKNYVVSQMDGISSKVSVVELPDYQLSDVCRIYNYLGHQETRDFYFQKWVEKFKMYSIKDDLERFQDAGFPIDRFEDLVHQDPIEVLNFANEEFIG